MLADVGCGHLSCAGCFTVQQLITRRSLNSGACTVLRSGLNESSVLPPSSIISQIQQIH